MTTNKTFILEFNRCRKRFSFKRQLYFDKLCLLELKDFYLKQSPDNEGTFQVNTVLNNGTIVFSGKVKRTGKADVEAAKKFFKMLDKDEDGKISRVSLL